jgi:hypothetical protein
MHEIMRIRTHMHICARAHTHTHTHTHTRTHVHSAWPEQSMPTFREHPERALQELRASDPDISILQSILQKKMHSVATSDGMLPADTARHYRRPRADRIYTHRQQFPLRTGQKQQPQAAKAGDDWRVANDSAYDVRASISHAHESDKLRTIHRGDGFANETLKNTMMAMTPRPPRTPRTPRLPNNLASGTADTGAPSPSTRHVSPRVDAGAYFDDKHGTPAADKGNKHDSFNVDAMNRAGGKEVLSTPRNRPYDVAPSSALLLYHHDDPEVVVGSRALRRKIQRKMFMCKYGTDGKGSFMPREKPLLLKVCVILSPARLVIMLYFLAYLFYCLIYSSTFWMYASLNMYARVHFCFGARLCVYVSNVQRNSEAFEMHYNIDELLYADADAHADAHECPHIPPSRSQRMKLCALSLGLPDLNTCHQ